MSEKKWNNGLSRKDFLKNSAAASALMMGAGLFTNGCSTNGTSRPGDAKNVIFLVTDGMSIGTLTSTDMTMRRKLGRISKWIDLYEKNKVRRSLMDVAPLDAIVTDSAASACAWGCGYRVPVRHINIGPNDEHYTPILTHFKNAGKSTGLVTTARITHATPAGFAANVIHRNYEDEIADQYYEREHDLYLGGGDRHFDASKREDGRDLYGDFSSKGYQVVKNSSELASASKDGKLLGVFSDGHLPYELDRVNTPDLLSSVPSLAEMTEAALDRLSPNSNGFILQVEGGRIDHGAHGNDLGGLIYDQIAFDDAIGVVLNFQKDNPDTLVIITTDHGNASPTLNRSFNGYEATEIEFDRIQNFKYTNDWVLAGLDENSRVNYIRERVEEATRIGITAEQARILQQALRGEHRALYEMMSPPDATLGAIMANYTSVNWTGTSHTGDYVQLAALGPGSDKLNGFTINTELFYLMAESAGVETSVEV
jgi:alkaline phosphatase